MPFKLVVPSATASAVDHADWFELNALLATDGKYSVQDFLTALRRSGSTDAVGDLDSRDYCSDEGAEQSMRVAEDAFSEIESRAKACGSTRGYPFSVHERCIHRTDTWQSLPYSVLLLLPRVGHDAGPSKLKGAKLFENLSAQAVRAYLGGPHEHVDSIVFGFPRTGKVPKPFKKAVNYLCQRFGEGGKFKHNPKAKWANKKDDGLDVVAWRDFEDKRPGKFIVFGQCASGKNRDKKTQDLDVRQFCSMWLVDQPLVRPAKMFFVPDTVDRGKWQETCLRCGIVFDRCRIASYAACMATDTIKECRTWVKYVVKHEVSVAT